MPNPETRNLTDYAVLWVASTKDNYGEYTSESAIEISVRWEDIETEATDSQAKVETTLAEVFVDRDIAIGSMLWHGRLANLPDSPTGVVEVIGFDSTPDIKGRVKQRTVQVSKFKGTVPEPS